MAENKYAVFKTEDAIAVTDGYVTFEVIKRIEDGVVIRRQDVFAPPALDAYSNAIQTTIEGINQTGALIDNPDLQEVVKGLRSIADYFHEQAQIAWDTSRKLPD